jgi:hypothetical protein
MSIHNPVRVEGPGFYVMLVDAKDRVIAGGLLREDAEEICNALNSQPKRKSKKIAVEEALRRSDLMAQLAGRDDIEHGHHDQLPRGEHVANLKHD